MNTKKALLMVVLVGFCSVILFAEIIGTITFYDNERINITEYIATENVFGTGRIQKHRYPVITNKTNNDMEVTFSYTLFVYGQARSGSSMITREKNFTNEKVTIRPHGSHMLLSTLEFIDSRNSAFKSAFSSDISYIDSILITNFELVSFRVIERNYEIR
jgi:uncharacterized membrane protein